MKLQVLGCSGGIGQGLRTSSYLIENSLLLDAGSGVGDLSLAQMRAIRHVFISHSHVDHVLSLPLMVDTLFDELCEQPLQVHARPETIAILKQHLFNWQLWPDFTELPNPAHPVLEFVPMLPGDTLQINELQIEMVEVKHTVPACGYIVQTTDEEQARVFVYSGDTTTNNTLWDRLNQLPRLDFLIVEAAFSNADEALAKLAKHYSPGLLAADLHKLEHRPRIGISHLKPGMEQQIFDECCAALPDYQLCRLNSGEHFQI
ncbi:MAG TPA: 3',5'-cyclic-nucleotide phosphodiesterase [Gammaproteobacteria bacterium]